MASLFDGLATSLKKILIHGERSVGWEGISVIHAFDNILASYEKPSGNDPGLGTKEFPVSGLNRILSGSVSQDIIPSSAFPPPLLPPTSSSRFVPVGMYLDNCTFLVSMLEELREEVKRELEVFVRHDLEAVVAEKVDPRHSGVIGSVGKVATLVDCILEMTDRPKQVRALHAIIVQGADGTKVKSSLPPFLPLSLHCIPAPLDSRCRMTGFIY